MGFDSAFGHGARGTAEYLQAIPDLSMALRISPPLLLEGEAVSSSVVRRCLEEGDLTRAQRLPQPSSARPIQQRARSERQYWMELPSGSFFHL